MVYTGGTFCVDYNGKDIIGDHEVVDAYIYGEKITITKRILSIQRRFLQVVFRMMQIAIFVLLKLYKI